MNPKHFMAHHNAFKVEQKMKSPFISKLPSNNFPTLTVSVIDNINANHCPFSCRGVPCFQQLIIRIVITRHWLALGQQSHIWDCGALIHFGRTNFGDVSTSSFRPLVLSLASIGARIPFGHQTESLSTISKVLLTE